MQRMKTFGKYALILIAFYLLSTLIINLALKSSYRQINGDIYSNSVLKFEAIEGKATYVNGYVQGKIKNNTEDHIEKKYIKIDLYSENNVKMGTKYIELNNINKYETRDFRMAFKLTNVKKFEIRFVDSPEPEAEESQFISEEMKTLAIFGAIILLMII